MRRRDMVEPPSYDPITADEIKECFDPHRHLIGAAFGFPTNTAVYDMRVFKLWRIVQGFTLQDICVQARGHNISDLTTSRLAAIERLGRCPRPAEREFFEELCPAGKDLTAWNDLLPILGLTAKRERRKQVIRVAAHLYLKLPEVGVPVEVSRWSRSIETTLGTKLFKHAYLALLETGMVQELIKQGGRVVKKTEENLDKDLDNEQSAGIIHAE